MPRIEPANALRKLTETYLRTVDKRQDGCNFLLHASMGLDKVKNIKKPCGCAETWRATSHKRSRRPARLSPEAKPMADGMTQRLAK